MQRNRKTRRKQENINSVGDSDFLPRGEYSEIIALWSLRILVELGGYKATVRGNTWYDDDILRPIGLTHLEDEDVNRKTALAFFKKRLQEVKKLKPVISGNLFNNINLLGDTLSLSDTEREMLGFITILAMNPDLQVVIQTLGTSLYKEKLINL